MAKSDSEMTSRDIEPGAIVTEPGSADQYQTGGWRSQKPTLDRNKCTKCGLCYIYCPEGAIQPSDDNSGYYDINLFYCKGCGICSHECPVNAITMSEEGE